MRLRLGGKIRKREKSHRRGYEGSRKDCREPGDGTVQQSSADKGISTNVLVLFDTARRRVYVATGREAGRFDNC